METIMNYMDRFFVNGMEQGIFSIVIMILITFILNRLINSYLKHKAYKNTLVIKRVKRIILWIILLAGIFVQIRPLSSIVTTLLASGGILAVTVGLASQEAATTLLNGTMIMIYKPFTIGDFIILTDHGVRGYVRDISLHHTKIETLEKTQLIIPNNIMSQAIVENVSQVTIQKANHFFITIGYNCDADKAIQIIQEEAINHPLFLKNESIEPGKPQVPVFCTAYEDSGITLRATVTTASNETGFQLLSDLRLSVLKRFQENDIDIPYPHHVIINKEEE